MTDSLGFLTSPAGKALLEQLATEDLRESNHLRLLTQMRRDYGAEDSRSALELAILRQKAVSKFGADAARMFFTRDALEQASDPAARGYRAERLFNCLGAKSKIIDAGCSIGADALAMAAVGLKVVGLDLDPLRIAMAQLNASALGVNATFAEADVRLSLPPAEAVFFDPARRASTGKRLHHIEDYQPPLSLIHEWEHALVVVKLSPGVDLDQLVDYAGEVEFISVEGDLKEAILWRGEGLTGLRATRIDATGVHHFYNPTREALSPAEISTPRGWLLEPDPAILRAGLVGGLAADLNGWQLDATIAYITTEERPVSSWVRAWRIREWLPFNMKKLKAYLREHSFGQVTIKKRGFPMTPEEVLAALKPRGENACTLVMTRWAGQPIVIVCDDFTPEQIGRDEPADEEGDTC
ncbi:MAG TPA: class I SAM-dependent methyltransferase [Aggregatilineales bacterium]|nr:class I SAM-dependent methyltransferase [Aggregatilineales bacterium]